MSGTVTLENSLAISLNKTKHATTIVLDMHPRKIKTYVDTKICT